MTRAERRHKIIDELAELATAAGFGVDNPMRSHLLFTLAVERAAAYQERLDDVLGLPTDTTGLTGAGAASHPAPVGVVEAEHRFRDRAEAHSHGAAAEARASRRV